MKFEILGKNMRVSDDLRDRVTTKLQKYEKYFHSQIVVHVNFSYIKNFQIVEITIPLKNGTLIRVEEQSMDMKQSIDKAVDKLDRQIRKHKTAMRKRYQGSETIRFDQIPDVEPEEDSSDEVIRFKSIPVKPMDVEEAIMQMKLLGHNFFVFQNAETNEVNVLYSRKNGGYGLIEPIVNV